MKTTQMIKTNNGMIRRNIYEVETATHLMKTVGIEDELLYLCGLSHNEWPQLGKICRMSHKNQGGIGCRHGDRCPISVDGFIFNERMNKNVAGQNG